MEFCRTFSQLVLQPLVGLSYCHPQPVPDTGWPSRTERKQCGRGPSEQAAPSIGKQLPCRKSQGFYSGACGNSGMWQGWPLKQVLWLPVHKLGPWHAKGPRASEKTFVSSGYTQKPTVLQAENREVPAILQKLQESHYTTAKVLDWTLAFRKHEDPDRGAGLSLEMPSIGSKLTCCLHRTMYGLSKEVQREQWNNGQ